MKRNSNHRTPSCGWLALGTLLFFSGFARAEDIASLCVDRSAIERVYYEHRTGTKPPFETTLPWAALENLVRRDLKKEAVLRKNYGVIITPGLLDAEVRRINSTTRAPEMLVEIKVALGGDPARFAGAFAKPLLVERLLRDKFENDDALHAPQRRKCEELRVRLLSAKSNGAGVGELLAQLRRADSNAVTETTWQLTPRPADATSQAAAESEIKRQFGADAQLLTPTSPVGSDRVFYFDDLPGAFKRVLRAQLRQAGDVSAVIELPEAFLLCLALEKSETVLSVGACSVPKRSYDRWLDEQE